MPPNTTYSGWGGQLHSPVKLLILGGITYTLGALIYAFKWPDPFPSVIGYHEIFHILVVVGSGFHFALNYNIATN